MGGVQGFKAPAFRKAFSAEHSEGRGCNQSCYAYVDRGLLSQRSISPSPTVSSRRCSIPHILLSTAMSLSEDVSTAVRAPNAIHGFFGCFHCRSGFLRCADHLPCSTLYASRWCKGRATCSDEVGASSTMGLRRREMRVRCECRMLPHPRPLHVEKATRKAAVSREAFVTLRGVRCT